MPLKMPLKKFIQFAYVPVAHDRTVMVYNMRLAHDRIVVA